MTASATISPINSLVFIHGPQGWTSPLPVKGQLVWSTPSCIATACYPEVDGPTRIVLGLANEVAIQTSPAFDGVLDTPQGEVVITMVADDRPVLRHAVQSKTTRVRIWHSDPRWPEIVTIGLN